MQAVGLEATTENGGNHVALSRIAVGDSTDLTCSLTIVTDANGTESWKSEFELPPAVFDGLTTTEGSSGFGMGAETQDTYTLAFYSDQMPGP